MLAGPGTPRSHLPTCSNFSLQDENGDDTAPLVNHVAECGEEVAEKKKEIEAIESSVEEELPKLEGLQDKIELQQARNVKIQTEIEVAETVLQKFISEKGKVQDKLDKSIRQHEDAKKHKDELQETYNAAAEQTVEKERAARNFQFKVERHNKGEKEGGGGGDEDEDEAPTREEVSLMDVREGMLDGSVMIYKVR